MRARGSVFIQSDAKRINDHRKKEESARVGKLTYLSGALQRQVLEVGTIRTVRALETKSFRGR